MRNLKIVLIFTLVIIQPNKIFGQSRCANLRSQILALESKQTNSQLNACKDAQETNCCRESELGTCNTLGQMESEYNSLLSKIVMLDSLMSLGSIIEKDHNIIQNIPLKDINAASKSVDDLFYNLNKSKIISMSLEAKNKDFFWKGFDKNSFTMSEWIKLKCENSNYKNFCLELKSSVNSIQSEEYIDDLSETLLGLANSTQYALDNNLEKDLKNYQSYLELSVNGEKVSYSELENSEHLNKLKSIKKLISAYKTNKDPQTAKQIIKISSELEDLKVNYSKDMEKNLEQRLTSFNKENISEPISKIKYALDGYIGLNSIKDSLSKNNKIIKSESKRLSKSLDLRAKSFFKDSKKACPSQDYSACLLEYKNVDDIERVTIQKLISDFSTLENLDKISISNSNTISCLKDPKKDKSDCYDDLKTKVNYLLGDDTLDSLKKKLSNQEKLIEYAKKGEPIINNNFTLAYSLNLYKKTCSDSSFEKVEKFISLCDNKTIDNINYQAMQLGKGTDLILLNLTRNNYIKDGKMLDNAQVDLLTAQFKAQCKEKKDDALCIADRELDNKARKYREGTKRLSQNSYNLLNTVIKSDPESERIYEEEQSYKKAAIGQATARGAMNVLGGLFQFNQMHQTHQRRMQSYNSNLDQMRYWNNYRQNNPLYQYTNVPGYPHTYTSDYTPYQPRPATFQGKNSNMIYYNSYDFSKIDFANPVIYNPVSDNSLDYTQGIGL